MEIDFKVARDKESLAVVGFGLKAQPDRTSESFCLKLPQLLINGDASLTFHEDTLLVDGRQHGKFAVRLDPVNAADVRAVLTDDVTPRKIVRDGTLVPGFLVIPETSGKDDVVTEEISDLDQRKGKFGFPTLPANW